MAAETPLPWPLLGLFRELIANGVPLGTRDYLEGLEALRTELVDQTLSACSRARLCELTQLLWARSDEERRLITRWFEAVPPTAATAIDAFEASAATHDVQAPSRRPSVHPPTASAPGAPRDDPAAPQGEARRIAGPKARVSFAGSGETGGIPVPRLMAEPILFEDYVLQPKALISSRELSVLLRRYRRASRHGPRRELDVQATIRARCRDGQLRAPIYRAQRTNTARLVVLADVSPSMAPWSSFLDTLADSLALGRLDQTLRYFSNLPRRQLFLSPDMRQAEPLDTALQAYAGASLLVISDAGAARSVLNRRRAARSLDFLEEAGQLFPTIVWLNPMPEARWGHTTAELIARGPARMLPLSPANLSLTIDVLRGNK